MRTALVMMGACLWACGDDAATGGAAAGGAAGGAGAGAGVGGGGGGGFVPLECPDPAPPVGYFAAPTGSPAGDGSEANPWDLATAIQADQLPPGSALYLRGGTYAGSFVPKLDGTPEAPITVQSYPGEWAVIDGGSSSEVTFEIYHSYTTFQNFEITNSNPDRTSARPSGVYVEGDHIRLVNLVIHDVGTGVICNSGDGPDYAPELEVYGCLLFNNGWEEDDRGHGHHLYLQNKDGTKHIRHNVLFHAFGFGVHAYSETDSNWIQGYDLIENVWFGNGASTAGPGSKLYDGCLVGHNGSHPVARVLLEGNLSWNPPGERSVQLGYSAPSDDVTITDNYLVGGINFSSSFQSITMTGNSFIGSVDGVDPTAYPLNDYLEATPPTATKVVVLPNEATPGRALVVVHNWALADSVEVDLSSVLTAGSAFEVRRAQSYSSPPVLTGTFTGAPITLAMGSIEVTQPIGLATALDPNELPGKSFDVFMVQGCQ